VVCDRLSEMRHGDRVVESMKVDQKRVYRENKRSWYTEMRKNSGGRENWLGKLPHSSWCLFICHIPGASHMLQTQLNSFKIVLFKCCLYKIS